MVPAYHAGSLRKTTVRLSKVQTYAGAAMVADYRLAYAQGSATGRSQLTSVTLCDGAGSACLPATTFAWQSGTTATTTITNIAGQNGTLSGYRPYVADFNGDGLADIMWDAESQTPATSTGTRVLWTGTGGGDFTVTSNFAGQDGQLSGYVPVIADFNRDGRPDVWWYAADLNGSTGATKQWMSTSSGSYTVATGPSAPTQNADVLAGLRWRRARRHVVVREQQVEITGGPSPMARSWAPATVGDATPGPAGRAATSRAPCRWAQEISTATASAIFSGSPHPGYPAARVWSTWLGLGPGGGFPTYLSGSDGNLNGYNPLFVDINGDGKTDVLWYSADSNGPVDRQPRPVAEQGRRHLRRDLQRRRAQWHGRRAIAPTSWTSTATACPTSCGSWRVSAALLPPRPARTASAGCSRAPTRSGSARATARSR